MNKPKCQCLTSREETGNTKETAHSKPGGNKCYGGNEAIKVGGEGRGEGRALCFNGCSGKAFLLRARFSRYLRDVRQPSRYLRRE